MFSSDANFELQVRPRGRSAADEYYHQGNWFIEGREGNNYTLWFNNRTNHRVMVILSVDGLDVCKGQPAGPNSDGYIVDALSSIEIPGWKLDNQNAAEFYFSGIGKSYASVSNANTNNVGVIGAMVFREQAQYVNPFPGWTTGVVTAGGIDPGNWAGQSMIYNGGMMSGITRGTATSHPGVACSSTVGMNTVGMNSVQLCASGASPGVGTGFGNSTQFKTAEVQFIRANVSIPDALMVVYYNSARNLQRMGIQLRTKRSRYDTSNASAFPGYTTGCTPPSGWTK